MKSARVEEALRQENIMLELSKAIIADIIFELTSKDVDMPGVKRISDSPRCVSVKLSTVMANDMNLSAQYYISQAQIDRVVEKIKGMSRLSQVQEYLHKLLEDGYVTFGSNKNDRIKLNPTVTAELRNLLSDITIRQPQDVSAVMDDHSIRCDECDAENCAYNPNGVCKFALVYGREPRLSDDGCKDFCFKEDDENE